MNTNRLRSEWTFFIMLRNQEKNLVVRGIFLIGVLGLGLDSFYEGDKKGGF